MTSGTKEALCRPMAGRVCSTVGDAENADYFPDLEVIEESHQAIGSYGRMRKAYLEEHRPGLYTRLILSGKLYEHLAEINACCSERMDQMIHQTAARECINEELKASDQIAWVGQMNSIRQQAEEIILNELIYV